MSQATLSSLPQGTNHFMLIHHPDPDLVLLPRWFVSRNPILIPYQNVLLTDPANNTFSLSLRTVEGRKGIKGFQEICKAHHINGTARVHYTYIAGSQFNIRIFLDEYTEVAYIHQEEEDFDVEEEDFDDEEEDFDDEEEEFDDEEELAWFSVITKPRSFGRQCLHVPASVALELIPHKPPTLNIILPDGNLDVWTLKWASARPNAVEFGHGWYEFGKEKRIRTRDQLRFYKTDLTDTYRLEVRRR